MAFTKQAARKTERNAESLLQELAQMKIREADILMNLAELAPQALNQAASEPTRVSQQKEVTTAELQLVQEQYNVEDTRMVLALGYRLMRAYDYQRGKIDKLETFSGLAEMFNISRNQLIEICQQNESKTPASKKSLTTKTTDGRHTKRDDTSSTSSE